MKPRPAIVDTNVVVAALLTSDATSPTARVLDGMLRGDFPYLVSTALLAEYRTVLLRPRIRTRHGLTDREVDEILTAIAANAIVREPAEDPASQGAPDPGDRHLWDLLASAPDAVLLTGDAALIGAAPSDASVLTPGAWFEA